LGAWSELKEKKTANSADKNIKNSNFLRLVPTVLNSPPDSTNYFLPTSLTPFVGRQNEVEAVCDLFTRPEIHLVTLHGTAGTGKTRLSLAVGEHLQTQFQHGVFFVNLAPINTPELGLVAIAQALGLPNHSQLPPLEKLQSYLQKRELLLILDNFEQIVAMGSAISELLQAAPQLKVLVTSRVVLRLYGEYVYIVPTLDLPVLTEETSFESFAQNEAVRLFVQCASMVNPEFKLTHVNAEAIASVCVHLEGLPLAIELAAAHCNVFSPQILLERLARSGSTRFKLLVGGFSNLPPRQQSLADALDWSYQLLSEPEKQLFKKLGIFVGSCSLAAAEAMSSDSSFTVETITSLLSKSLLKPVEAMPGEEFRFTMLETIREYALEKLTESGELDLTRKAYMGYFTEMVETVVAHLKNPDQLNWLKCLAADHSNILSVLDYLIENEEVERAFQWGGNIWRVWWRWGYLNQGRQWLNKILALDNSMVESTLRAKLLDGIAYLALYQNDYRTAETYFEQSLPIWREEKVSKHLANVISGLSGAYRIIGKYDRALQLNYEVLELYRLVGEVTGEANTLCNIAWQLMERGDHEPVQVLVEEALAIHTKANYAYGMARTKIYLGDILWRNNNPTQAIQCLEEAITVIRQLGHDIRLPAGLYRLGLIYLCQGQMALAEKVLEESVEIAEEMDKAFELTYAYSSLGLVRMLQDNLSEAEHLFRQALKLRLEIGNQLEGVLWSLEGLAVIALKQAKYDQAPALMEEAQILRQTLLAPILPHTVKYIMPQLISLQKDAKISLHQVDHLKFTSPIPNEKVAVELDAFATATLVEQSVYPKLEDICLSERESQVLKLVAEGHPTSQIAKILVISPGTVNSHLASIYSKLGVNSRTAAMRYALDHNLL
jgi:predicted ATPase/DNA-binding CsgD family transcriptional regulator